MSAPGECYLGRWLAKGEPDSIDGPNRMVDCPAKQRDAGTINLLCGCVIGKNRGWLVGNGEVEINIANNMMGDEEEQDDDDD